MDSLKTIFVIGVLAAIAYGVYVKINNDQQVASSSEATDGWPSGPPDVQLGGQTEAPPFSFGAPGEGTMPGEPPSMSIPSTGASAPTAGPYANNHPGIADPPGAPPFSAQKAQTRVPTQDMLSGNTAPPFGRRSSAATTANRELPSPIGQAGSAPSSRHGMAAPDVSASARLSPGIGRPSPDQVRRPFAEFIAAAKERLDQGNFVEIYEALSGWHGEQRLTADEDRQLTELLDQIAGTVVYSTEHYLEPAYRVRPGDTLDQIAATYNVTPQLLAKINGIDDPRSLAPGTELKVVRGPFDATIDLDKLELTLKLQGRYAGRFLIGTGNDYPQLEGSYTVRQKMFDPTYYGREGTIADNDPDNPLGKRWIGLDNQIGIHGTNDPRNVGAVDGRGAICLGDRDIDDVFDILTVGSRVVIRR
jgi:lipoprotein-anchoring transpeptidase ErfK/SrfK